MINLFRPRDIVAMLALLTLATACTSKPEAQMTPEQSRQVFITEAKAIIQAVFPGADPRVVILGKDIPCGGPVGTEFTSVESSITVRGVSPNSEMHPDEVFQKVIEVLRQRGWTINYASGRIAGAELKGVGGISAGVGGSPIGISIGGDTECVKNPDA